MLDELEWGNYLDEHGVYPGQMKDAWPGLAACIQKAISTIKSGNKILFAGNGGSFSMACHLAAELMGRFEKDRRAFPAVVLGGNPAELTAIANDYGFQNVFSRCLEGLGKPGDMVIMLSTSGTSKNIVALHLACTDLKFDWSLWASARMSPVVWELPLPYRVIRSPSKNTAVAQVHHLIMGHFMCKKIEEACL